MLAWFTRDDNGLETIFSNDPQLIEDEEVENPYSEYPEPIRYIKTGKKVWNGDVLFESDSYEGVFPKNFGLPNVTECIKIPIEINIRIL